MKTLEDFQARHRQLIAADRALTTEFCSACNSSTDAAFTVLISGFKPRFAALRSQWEEFSQAIENHPEGEDDEDSFDELSIDASERLAMLSEET